MKKTAKLRQIIDSIYASLFIWAMPQVSLGISKSLVMLSALLLVSTFAWASQNQNRFQRLESTVDKNFSLNAQLSGVQYFSESAEDSNFQQQAEVQALYEKQGTLLVKAQGLVGTFSLSKSSYFAAPEFFVGLSSENAAADEKSQVVFGRKIKNFSFLDQQQNLGLFNSYFTNDMIRYQQQGLVGVHTELQFKKIGFYAGYYPIYLPNQGPQVYEEDGEIRSSNRWSQKPPSQFRFGNLDREIVYAIRDYDIDDIIQNGGEGLSLYFGESSQRPWIQASYARKPVNQIPLTRDTYGTASNFIGQVNLSPVVTYSQAQAVDLNFDIANIKSTISYLEDRVFNKVAAEGETLQFLKPLKMYGIWVAVDFSEFFRRKMEIEVSYAELNDGEIQDLLADGRTSIFTYTGQRSLFKKPVSVKLNSELLFIESRPLSTAFKWTYDEFYNGSLFSGSISYQTLARLNLNFGFDLLGVEEETKEAHFLQDKQANDRVYGGLEYVF